MTKLTPEFLAAYEAEQLAKYTAEVEGYKPGIDYQLCRVEGCIRNTPAGQIGMCGGLKIGVDFGPDDPYCGSATTIQLWEAKGLI